MRQVDAAAQITLDGVMQAPGAPEEDPSGRFAYACWAVPYLDDVLGEAAEDGFTKPFGLLLGRRTYEIFAGHWPYDEGRYSSGRAHGGPPLAGLTALQAVARRHGEGAAGEHRCWECLDLALGLGGRHNVSGKGVLLLRYVPADEPASAKKGP